MGGRKIEIRNQELGIRGKVIISFLISYFCFISISLAQETIKESLSELNRILPLKKVVKEPLLRKRLKNPCRN